MYDEFGNDRIIRGVTHCFTTSSGTSTQAQQNQYLGSQIGAAGTGGNILGSLLPQLSSQANQGLTPLEESYYGGEIQKGVAENTASAEKSYSDSMARQGNLAGRGAVAEGESNIARGGVQATASGLSSLQGMDISKQQQNLKNLFAAIGLGYSPSPIGQTAQGTTTSTMSPLMALASII
jgi:hypothetical protein